MLEWIYYVKPKELPENTPFNKATGMFWWERATSITRRPRLVIQEVVTEQASFIAIEAM